MASSSTPDTLGSFSTASTSLSPEFQETSPHATSNASPAAKKTAPVRNKTSTLSRVTKPSSDPPEKHRRNRQIKACLACRSRKSRCDRGAPACEPCTKNNTPCVYFRYSKDDDAVHVIDAAKDKLSLAERTLEHGALALRSEIAGDTSPGYAADDSPPEDERNLVPTAYAVLDNIQEPCDDELLDLGIQIGKMRMTERIGGWVRPKLMEELDQSLSEEPSANSRSSSTTAFDPSRSIPSHGRSLNSWVGAGRDYIPPSSGTQFPFHSASGRVLDYLPLSRQACDELVAQYWTAVHYMCKVVHRPSFEKQYEVFWSALVAGSEPVPPVSATVFAVLFSAAVSMDDKAALHCLHCSKMQLVQNLRLGTEAMLSRANFLAATKLDTMQAFTLYLIPLVRSEVTRAHSALVATAIRLAQCMGLHRDGSLYDMHPVEVQVRRMIWHQLCFLDMRMCYAMGPRPQIRRDEYDTQLPWNVNDVDLVGTSKDIKEKKVWTDATFMLLRAETIAYRRQAWFDIIDVDRGKRTLTALLVGIRKFITATEEKYARLLDTTIPFQKLAQLVFRINAQSLYLGALHRYLPNTSQPMPARLRQVLVEAGLAQMEAAIEYERSPDLQVWTWYLGAFMQYHCALLLLLEVHLHPERREALRLWRCLDDVFGIPAHLTPKQKTTLVLEDVRDRVAEYQQRRRTGTPQVEHATPDYYRVENNANEMVDAHGHMLQQPLLPPAGYGNPNVFGSFGSFGGSFADGAMMDMSGGMAGDLALLPQNLDWMEFDRHFPQAPDLPADPALYTAPANYAPPPHDAKWRTQETARLASMGVIASFPAPFGNGAHAAHYPPRPMEPPANYYNT